MVMPLISSGRTTRATPKGGGEVHVIGEASEYLDAIDRRAQELSALAEGVPMAFSTRGHPCVDHIRVTRTGASFEVQVISHTCVSLPPAAFDDDPHLGFR